jgi:hypothetical protein
MLARPAILLATSCVLLVACAVAMATAYVPQRYPSWYRPVIEQLSHANFTEEYTLYRRVAGAGSSNASSEPLFSWTAAGNYSSAVTVQRNSNASGWDVIQFAFTAEDADEYDAGYYAAGYAEGYLTFLTTYATYINTVSQMVAELDMVEVAQQFLRNQTAYLADYPNTTDYGRQLYRQTELMRGIADGWNAYYDAHPEEVAANDVVLRMTFTEIFNLNYQNGLANLIAKYDVSSPTAKKILKSRRESARCSALMKLTDTELYFAHDTWSGYNGMLRQYKTYAFGDRVVSFSGYPATISSTDDFYITSNNLAITETTNGILNNTLYQYITPDLVPEFHRVMIANFVATSPPQWFALFARNNSGTYNNQYMVADMAAARNALDQGQPLPANTFWVGEQIPGLVVSEDQTAFLNTHKHWPSFNIPYYEEIYVLSGFYQADKDSYGLLSYTNYSRGKIFAKMQGQIQNETAMWYMMRYNDFQADPDSFIPWCSPAGPYNCSDNTQGASLTVASPVRPEPAAGGGSRDPCGSCRDWRLRGHRHQNDERDNDGEVEASNHHQWPNSSPTASLRL